jgi:hypothetical protein
MKVGDRVEVTNKNSIYKGRVYTIKYADQALGVYHLEFPNGDKVPFYAHEIFRCPSEVPDNYKEKVRELL